VISSLALSSNSYATVADESIEFSDALMIVTKNGAYKTNSSINGGLQIDDDTTNINDWIFSDFVLSEDGQYYMTSQEGLSISDDNGLSWSNLTTANGITTGSTYNVAVKTDKDGNWILVGSDTNGLSLSLNNGATFQTYNVANTNANGGLINDSINVVKFNELGELIIGSDGGLTLGYSPEVGITFESYTTNHGLADNKINDILMVEGDIDNKLYIATVGGLSVFDNGQFQNYFLGANISSFVIHNNVWYAGVTAGNGFIGGLYISIDQGQTFTLHEIAALQSEAVSVWSLAVTDNAIYAGTKFGIAVSSDGGENFVLFDNDNSELDGGAALVINKIVALSNTSIQIVAHDEGIAISKDSGQHFSLYNSSNATMGDTAYSAVYIGAQEIAVATSDGVSLSADLGTTWTQPLAGAFLYDINFSLDNNLLVASSREKGIFISTDKGANFTNKTSTDGLLSNETTSVAIAPLGIIYVSHPFDPLTNTPGGLSFSNNAGQTFSSVFLYENDINPFVQQNDEQKLNVDRVVVADNGDVHILGSDFYYVANSELTTATRIFQNNFGLTFLGTHLVDDNTFYVGTTDGLLITVDGGATSTFYNNANGLSDNFVNHVTLDASANIYASTEGGFNISRTGGEFFMAINTDDPAAENNASTIYKSLILTPKFIDSDYDGISDKLDTDDDNDGVLDADDAFPLDANESVDTDGDGIGNNIDTDDDGDGVLDVNDAYPLDSAESLDTDNDGVGNNADNDDDGDGLPDSYEAQFVFLDPLNSADAMLDQDGDSFNNLAEFHAVTNPDDFAEDPNASLFYKIISPEGSSFDSFGINITLFADTAMVTGLVYDSNSNFTRYVYIFNKNATGEWQQVQKLVAEDGWSFSGAISLYGDTAMIAATQATDNVVYVYNLDINNNWVLFETLVTADNGHEKLGSAISLQEDLALIGAYGVNGDGDSTGAAYIFERDQDNHWIEIQKITADTVQVNDHFSSSVSLSGNSVLIGAWNGSENGFSSGVAYVFQQDANQQWLQQAKLVAADANVDDLFGSSVSLDGDTALIGAFRTDSNGASSGSAYVFGRDNQGDWSEIQELTANDATTIAQFGHSVSLKGETALIGAWADSEAASYAGAAYVFSKSNAGVWAQQSKIIAPDAAVDEAFGNAVVLTSDTIMVGTDLEDGDSFGSVYFIKTDSDSDDDGVADVDDAFPFDNSESVDSDGDGVGNNADTDDDNDGVLDEDDEAPLDPAVYDITLPVVIVSNDIIVPAVDANGTPLSENNIAIFIASANANDNFDGVVAVTHDAPSTFPLATTIVTFTATDTAGNTGTATSTVTVADQTKPEITLSGNSSMILVLNDAFVEPGVTVLDNVDGDLSGNVIVSGSVNIANVGTYTLTYNVSDSAGNTATTKTRQVTVQDANAPVIVAPNNIIVAAVDANGTAATDNAITTFLTSGNGNDDVDGVVVVTNDSPSNFPLGATTVTFSAVDTAGNIGSATAIITVSDQTLPVITLIGELSITLNLNDVYTDAGALASDNVDGDITANVVVTGTVNIAAVGTYPLTYHVNDTAGNSAVIQIRHVTIQDPSLVDTDNDGVPDVLDAFPNDPNESVDTDGDGLGNNADTDDDNDGVLDADDLFPLADTEAPVFTELTPLIVEATGVMTDVTLEAPVATDNTGDEPSVVSDLVGALGLGEHEVTWTATDDAGNESSAVQMVSVEDTISPVFETMAPLILNAHGRLTDVVGLINATAVDLVDGEVSVTILDDTKLLSGQHELAILASDLSGNETTASLLVSVFPQASIRPSLNVEPGSAYNLDVNLSGDAPNYPVSIVYQLIENSVVIETNTIDIIAGIQGSLSFTVSSNVVATDNLSLIIIDTENTFVDSNATTQLIVIEHNVAPLLSVNISQNNENVSVVDPDNGLVTLTATISDVNQGNTHDIAWTSSHGEFDGASDVLSYSVDPSSLNDGPYTIDITATENNTNEFLSVAQSAQFVVQQLEPLTADNDSDEDGIADTEEGYSDSDGDGIVDYLDDDSNTMQLPSGDNIQPLQTAPGLTMSLGTLSKASGGSDSQYASLTIEDLANIVGEDAADTVDAQFEAITPLYNFVIDGLTEQGGSVAVVIPLASGSTLPADAVYRKYNTTNGWFTFEEDGRNSVRSAQTDASGNCPAANDERYSQGLSEGDNCIQLVIEDGGSNDADFAINGSVEDPGAVVIEISNHAPTVSIESHVESVEESTTIILTSTGSDIDNDTVSYLWEQLSGPSISFDDATASQVSIVIPEVSSDETIEVQVSISDGELSTTSTTSFTVTNLVAKQKSNSSGGSMGWLFMLTMGMALALKLRKLVELKEAA